MAAGGSLTCTLGEVPYYSHSQVVGTVKDIDFEESRTLEPLVLASVNSRTSTVDSILRLIATFPLVDDVYSEGFHSSLVLQGIKGDPLDHLLNAVHLTQRFKSIYTSTAESSKDLLPAGPYFRYGQFILQAWRIYPDDLDAFIMGVVPEQLYNSSRFRVLDATSTLGVWKPIAVPSRLYAKPSKEKPLAGLRVSLKDNYHLAGIQTTMMSRAYTELYGPEKESADYVDKLVALGAIIIGKTKMTAFASADEPTDQWVDFHCSTNPRGDRYQSPSGSSTGAAASMAGYAWLDYSIGTDTGGSIRAPATANGIFSLRPSFNTTSTKGIQASCKSFDVVGLFCRELQGLHDLASVTFNLQDTDSFPKKILYPVDFFPHSNPNQQAMVEEFISILERFLGTKRIEFSFIDRWNQCPPEAAKGKSLKEYLAKSAFWPMCYDFYHEFDQFRDDYRQKYKKEPYVGPVTTFRWGVGASVSREDYHQGWAELKVFRDWVDANVLSSHPETLSNAVMIMPYGMGRPKYRDAANENPSVSHTFGEKFISPALQMPQFVFPIGQNLYESKITGNAEYRPIATTLIGAKGSDLMLMKLVKAVLESASWPTRVLTGRYTFEVGNNTRNVADEGDLPHNIYEAGHGWNAWSEKYGQSEQVN